MTGGHLWAALRTLLVGWLHVYKAYASPLPLNGAGANLVNTSERFDDKPTISDDVCANNDSRYQRDDENNAVNSGARSRKLPSSSSSYIHF